MSWAGAFLGRGHSVRRVAAGLATVDPTAGLEGGGELMVWLTGAARSGGFPLVLQVTWDGVGRSSCGREGGRKKTLTELNKIRVYLGDVDIPDK